MYSGTTLASIIASVAAVAGTALLLSFQVGHEVLAADSNMMMGTPSVAIGNVGNVQVGASGEPEWIQTGFWVLRISSVNDQPTAHLIARFAMVKPDGTAMHVHKIYNFSSTEMTMEGNSTKVFKGTATITMKDGPVSQVPLTLKVFNDAVIGFWIGPDMVDGHFGTSPMYGTLSERSSEVMQDIQSLIQGMGGSGGTTPPAQTIKMSAKEIDEVYRWSTDDGINPTLKLVANKDNMIQIQNPTDTKHELVFESNGSELAASGDIEPNSSGELTYKPTTAGTFEYHCEYHPDTMKGTVEVTGPS